MIQHDIEQLIHPTLSSMGYELWGCEYLAQGKHSLLRIYIDSPVGIGMEDCEKVSRQISAILDVEDPISGHYTLEVSSPGVPRPLFHGHQYQRYIGLEVQIKLFKPLNGKRKFTGVVVSVDDEGVVLSIDQQHQPFLFSNIVKASLAI